MNYKLFKDAPAEDQILYLQRLRWIVEVKKGNLGVLQNNDVARIMRVAKRRKTMWEAFEGRINKLKDDEDLNCSDLTTKLTIPTTNSPNVQDLKKRWDTGEFDDVINNCGRGLIDALDQWLKQTKDKLALWIKKQRTGEAAAKATTSC